MSDDSMVRARRRPDGTLEQILPDGTIRRLEGTTDWARLNAMTEEEIEANALSDPDNPPLTPERLAKMRRIPNTTHLRQRLDLTQEEFARQFQISLGTLRDWEQGVRMPDSTAIAYLRVIEKIPDAVRQALHQDESEGAAETNETRGARTA